MVAVSNGARVRLWKVELQKLADETGLCSLVLHLPPGTSKWNKIEHRLFSFISKNWRGRPLTDYRTIVELIGATTSTTGLTVRCQLDENLYPAGIKVSDEEMAALNILRNEFHGGRVEDWRAGRPCDRAAFPAPSTSHAACGFPALRAPICFTPRLIPIMPGPLSVRRVAPDSR